MLKEFLSDLSNQSAFISYFPPLHFKVRTWRTTMWWNQINGLLWQMNFSISVVYVLLLKLYFDDYHLNLTFSLCLSLKRGRREQSEVTFESCNCSYETFKLLSFLFWRWLKIPHTYIKIKRYGNFVLCYKKFEKLNWNTRSYHNEFLSWISYTIELSIS